MSTGSIDYEDLKKRGFLRQRQEGFFVARTRMTNGVYRKEELDILAGISQRYARGIVHATTRQGLEIPFVKLEDIPAVERLLQDAGIKAGTSGARLRTTTTCPGNNWCRQGLIDTFSLGRRIEDEFGMTCGMTLPHKFKISISGCPNMCTRADASEIGIHGQVDLASADKRIGYAVYAGGCGGKNPKTGIKLGGLYTEDEVLALIGKIVAFYKAKARPRQRLALLIEEVGKDVFLKEIS